MTCSFAKTTATTRFNITCSGGCTNIISVGFLEGLLTECVNHSLYKKAQCFLLQCTMYMDCLPKMNAVFTLFQSRSPAIYMDCLPNVNAVFSLFQSRILAITWEGALRQLRSTLILFIHYLGFPKIDGLIVMERVSISHNFSLNEL